MKVWEPIDDDDVSGDDESVCIPARPEGPELTSLLYNEKKNK